MADNKSSTQTPLVLIGVMIGFMIPKLIASGYESYLKNKYESEKVKAGYYFYQREAQTCTKNRDALSVKNQKRDSLWKYLHDTGKDHNADGSDNDVILANEKLGRLWAHQLDSINNKLDWYEKKSQDILDSLDKVHK